VAEQTVTTATGEVLEYSPAISLDRRYIPGKESRAYILAHSFKSFNLGSYTSYFTYNVLNVDLEYMAKVTMIAGIWDIINDILIATIVDRTRTRFGKFKPYLVGFMIPCFFGNMAYWLLPVIFNGTTPDDPRKLIFYTILYVFRETMGTFLSAGATGVLATITPNPNERTKLITSSNFLDSIWGSAPEIATGVIVDLCTRDILGWTVSTALIGMAVFCTVIPFFFQARSYILYHERVMQSTKKPSIIDGIKSIINNRPMMMITLSNFLSAFTISGYASIYYVDVLNMASLKTIVGIPGSPISYLSYAFVPWFRRKFSTKALWFIQHGVPQLLWILVFLIGVGNYDNLYVMVPLLMIQEMVFCFFYALKKIIPTEIFNEAMDYCEWKNGYRTEAMTSVATGFATKLVATVTASVGAAVLKLINYQQGSTVQSDKTKFYIFCLFTIVPVITGALGYIPMLFYNLTGEKRDKMYADLMERRSAAARAATNAKDNEEG